MTNIEVFNRIAAEVFKELYEAFPKPILLQARKLREQAQIADEDWFEEARGIKGNSAGFTINWLNQEGFIRCGAATNDGSQFANVVLTTKGFTALSKTPESLETKPTIGDRLKELSRTASSEVVCGLVKIALTPFGGGN